MRCSQALKCFTSAIALLTALGAGPARADEALLDLFLRPGTDRGEGSIGLSIPLQDTDGSRTALDMRIVQDSKDRSIGSLGIGHRMTLGQFVGGAAVFYDWEDTELGNTFEQVTFGIDLTDGRFDVRANYYLPRDKEALMGTPYARTRFSGGQVFRATIQDREIAMKGFDAEAGVRVDVGDLDLGLYGGYYRFTETGAPDIDGFKARAEFFGNERWSFGLEVRNDDEFDTQYFATFRVSLGVFGNPPKRSGVATRLADPVQREFGVRTLGPGRNQPKVVVAEQAVSTTANGFALGGTAATFRFVGAMPTVPGIAVGSDTPFATLADALAASQPNDIIYVGTSQTGNFALRNGQQLFGAGTALTVGDVALFAAGTRPTLTALTGNVVTLANDNVVTGLRITAPAGSGAANRDQFAAVYGDNIRVGSIFNNDFTGNLGTGGTSSVGIRLDNMAGVAFTRAETRHFASNSTVMPYQGSYFTDTRTLANGTPVGLGNAEIISFSNVLPEGAFAAITVDRAPVAGESFTSLGAIDIVRIGEGDLAGVPILQRRDDIRTSVTAALGASAFGSITTVSMDPQGRFYAVAVPHSNDMTNGIVEIRNRATGAVIQRLSVGIGPDGTAISPDGRWLVVANEAENPVAPGSISVIDLANVMSGGATGRQLTFTDQTGVLFNNSGGPGRAIINMDVDGQPVVPVTHDPAGLQPEYVAFSPDGRFAFVTLQENNGVAVVDLTGATPTISRVFDLGTVTQSADIRNTNPPVYDFTGQITGFNREPDGVAAFVVGGQLFFMTADEGDTRGNFTGTRLRGGRSVSIFNATTGQLVGAQLGIDQALFAAANSAMAANPTIYGVRNDGVNAHYYPDGRSDRGGVEPEVLTTFVQNNRTYSLVGLERGASVMLMDVTNPAAPTIVTFGLLPRDMTRVSGFNLLANSEGIATLVVGGQRFGFAGLEDNGRIAIWRIGVP